MLSLKAHNLPWATVRDNNMSNCDLIPWNPSPRLNSWLEIQKISIELFFQSFFFSQSVNEHYLNGKYGSSIFSHN